MSFFIAKVGRRLIRDRTRQSHPTRTPTTTKTYVILKEEDLQLRDYRQHWFRQLSSEAFRSSTWLLNWNVTSTFERFFAKYTFHVFITSIYGTPLLAEVRSFMELLFIHLIF